MVSVKLPELTTLIEALNNKDQDHISDISNQYAATFNSADLGQRYDILLACYVMMRTDLDKEDFLGSIQKFDKQFTESAKDPEQLTDIIPDYITRDVGDDCLSVKYDDLSYKIAYEFNVEPEAFPIHVLMRAHSKGTDVTTKHIPYMDALFAATQRTGDISASFPLTNLERIINTQQNEPASPNLFDALKQGQDEDMSCIFDEAKKLFKSRPLSDRYARLLNVHFALNPRVPQEKIDHDLAKLAKSNDTQTKYDILHAVLIEQAQNILDCDGLNIEDLEIPQATLIVVAGMLTQANQSLETTIQRTQKSLDRMDDTDRFERIRTAAEKQGVLFIPPTQRPQ